MRLTISIIVSGLCDYRQICAKASILETLMQQAQDDAACAKYACSAVEKQYNELRFKKEIIECWLQLLPGVERFLVQTHLRITLDGTKYYNQNMKLIFRQVTVFRFLRAKYTPRTNLRFV